MIATVPLALAVLMAGAVGAASIHGTVLNGTTGTKDVEATVAIINPSKGGMAPIQTVQAADGRFSVEGLEPGAYLARVEYEGVTYNWPFQIAGDEHASISVTVYEKTSSWENLKVVVPHFTAARQGDHLLIERVYDIQNDTQPLRTVAGKEAHFRFPLPEQMHDFNALYVQYGDVPVQRQLVETDEKGVFELDYPIRPGLTRVVMSYTAEYDTGAVAMNETLQYDLEGFTIFATDPEMTIASSSHDLIKGEGPHSTVSWEIGGLKRGDVLNLSFSGGVDQQTASDSDSEQHTVIVVPNEAESLSMVLMVILLLALFAFTGIAIREPRIDGAEALRLAQHRNVLMDRLAKLDDLHETGAIPTSAYHAKRAEIKNQVASIMFRLGEGEYVKIRAGGDERSRA